MFNSRLSRVVSKLFARVVKAEEASLQSFSSATFDTEAIICCLEDLLVACENAEQEGKCAHSDIAASRSLAKVLLTAILKARGETTSVRSQMNDLGIDSFSSALGRLLVMCANELGLSSSSPLRHNMTNDVASLVSAVGSAPQGPERDAAINALKSNTSTHGDKELNDHLNEVSDAFRAFILEQLSEGAPKDATEPTIASSMSERIKNLRSKLNATEAVVQSAVVKVDSEDSETTFQRKLMGLAPLSDPNSPRRTLDSGIKQPSPSKIPTADTGGSASVRAFRARLAAAQEKRNEDMPSSQPDENPQATVSAGGRAAALRARLQAVKKQTGQAEF